MRAFPMCFSSLQSPRYGIHSLSSLWQDSFHRSSNKHGSHRRFNVISSKPNELEGGYSRRWIRSKTTETRKTIATSHNKILEEEAAAAASTSSATTLRVVNKTELNELLAFGSACDISQQLAESKDLHKLVTVIVFDLETTGFSRQFDRIIEIAFRDLGGGENSTFETLVNPERLIPNSHVHGINYYMVTRPGVPTMKELIPIMVQYIESRRKKGGYVLLVAHNGRTFDVPFLKSEFERCSFRIPHDWLFFCTLGLARQHFKGSKVSLEAMKESLEIKLEGDAHRAMADVNALSLVFRELTIRLEKTLANLVKDSFTASELSKTSSKKEKASNAKPKTSK
ncbi:unnamed protein product [Linum trigynum]|uniref:Exonuclease domain-containing protein n=1 Tax=Linum trigynum TaxID=586398 RepID=A0AAV2GB94_9ROSI